MTFIDWIRSHPCEVVGFSLLITLCLAIVASVVMSFIRDKCDEMLSRGWSSPEEVAEIGRAYRKALIDAINGNIEAHILRAHQASIEGDLIVQRILMERAAALQSVVDGIQKGVGK